MSIAKIEFNEELMENLVEEKVQKALEELKTTHKLAYTYDELTELTGLSRTGIEKYLLHDKEFVSIRRKVGRKWLFPVEETRKFLKEWLSKQPND